MPAAPDASAASSFSDEEIASLFDPLFLERRVLLAVSGGPDSMAMMVLAARWRAAHPDTPMEVGTLDHRLRAESANEALLVAEQAARLGLAHTIVAWDGPKPETGLLEEARTMRFMHMNRLAEDKGLDVIALAHTMDDQAETVLMRLIGGSGVSGLRGMDALSTFPPLPFAHVRPLLAIRKSRLIALLERDGIPYACDPTNEDTKYLRPRLRRTVLPVLAAEGLSIERLALIGRKMARADEALTEITHRLFDSPTTWRIDRAGYMSAPRDVRLRAIQELIDRIDGGRSLPEDAQLLRVDDAIMEHPTARVRRTLRRCLLEADARFVQVRREPPRRAR